MWRAAEDRNILPNALKAAGRFGVPYSLSLVPTRTPPSRASPGHPADPTHTLSARSLLTGLQSQLPGLLEQRLHISAGSEAAKLAREAEISRSIRQ